MRERESEKTTCIPSTYRKFSISSPRVALSFSLSLSAHSHSALILSRFPIPTLRSQAQTEREGGRGLAWQWHEHVVWWAYLFVFGVNGEVVGRERERGLCEGYPIGSLFLFYVSLFHPILRTGWIIIMKERTQVTESVAVNSTFVSYTFRPHWKWKRALQF